jgi:N-acetyltransferase
MASQRAPYAQPQLIRYLKRIRYFAQDDREESGHGNQLKQLEQSIQQNPLAVLSELQRRHLSAIPFGNSGLHYSRHHTISLDTESLFHKMIDRKLDGYCLESTGLLYNVLRSLDFNVYATGARVHDSVAGRSNRDQYGSLYVTPGETAQAVRWKKTTIKRCNMHTDEQEQQSYGSYSQNC